MSLDVAEIVHAPNPPFTDVCQFAGSLEQMLHILPVGFFSFILEHDRIGTSDACPSKCGAVCLVAFHRDMVRLAFECDLDISEYIAVDAKPRIACEFSVLQHTGALLVQENGMTEHDKEQFTSAVILLRLTIVHNDSEPIFHTTDGKMHTQSSFSS